MNNQRKRWLVLYSRPRYEKKIDSQLGELGISSYLPLRQEMHQWSDRKKVVEVPLFSSYIFVHVNERERVIALSADGVIKCVSFGKKLAVVSSATIANLKLMMTRPADVRVEQTALNLGQRVRVKYGPMQGLVGHLAEFRGHTRVILLVEAIHQAVSVEVPLGDLDPVRSTHFEVTEPQQ